MSRRAVTTIVAALGLALYPGESRAAQRGAHIALSCAFKADAFCSRLLAELQAAGHRVDLLPDGADLGAELAAPGAVIQVRQAPWSVKVFIRRDGALWSRSYVPDEGVADAAGLVAVQVAEGLRAILESAAPPAGFSMPLPVAEAPPEVPEVPEAPAAPPQLRPVRFDADGKAVVVTVDKAMACVTPCALQVGPGRHRVALEEKALDEELVLEDSTALVRVHRRDDLRMGLGIAGLAVGVPMAVAGIGLAVVGHDLSSPDQDYSQLVGIGVVSAVIGASVAGLGAALGLGTMGRDGVEPVNAGPKLESLGVTVSARGAMLGASVAF